MTASQLEARIGEPAQVHRNEEGMTWFYPGPDGTESFAYFFSDSTVVSTDVLITHPTPEASRARIDRVVDTLTQNGWRDMRLSLSNHLLHAGDSVYRVYLASVDLPNAVILSHMPRDMVKTINGINLDDLVAFHQSRKNLDPEIVSIVAGDSSRTRPLPTPAGSAIKSTTSSAPETEAASRGARYALIVASEPDETSADEHAARLRRRGLPVYVIPGDADGRRLYRVGLGWYDSRRAAMAARRRFPDLVPENAWPLAVAAEDVPIDHTPVPPQSPEGYTWIIAASSSEAAAESVVDRCRKSGMACSVYRSGKEGIFRVGMGWFESIAAMRAARAKFPPWFPPDAWPLGITSDMFLSK